MGDVTRFRAVEGGSGVGRKDHRVLYSCDGCGCMTFKLAIVNGSPILVECSNCESLMDFDVSEGWDET